MSAFRNLFIGLAIFLSQFAILDNVYAATLSVGATDYFDTIKDTNTILGRKTWEAPGTFISSVTISSAIGASGTIFALQRSTWAVQVSSGIKLSDGCIRLADGKDLCNASSISSEGGHAVLASTQEFSGGNTFTEPIVVSTETTASTTTANAIYSENIIKGWVNFSGGACSGTGGSCGTAKCSINDSFNVECVDRTATGTYFIYWGRDFANTNYAVSGVTLQDDTFVSIANSGVQTTHAKILVVRTDGALQDRSVVTLIAIGTQ